MKIALNMSHEICTKYLDKLILVCKTSARFMVITSAPEGFLSAGADSAIWGGFCNLRGGFCNLLGQNMQSENCPLKKGRIMQSAGRGGICNLRGGLCNL